MVQYFTGAPVQNQAGLLGSAIGQGIARNFEPPEQRVQRGVLSKAFEKLKTNKGKSLIDTLSAIGPEFMTAVGGPEALSSILPLLQNGINNQGYLEAGDKGVTPTPFQEANNAISENKLSKNTPVVNVNPEKKKTPLETHKEEADLLGNQYRKPQPPSQTPETGNFPSRTVEQPQPLMNSDQIDAYARRYVQANPTANRYFDGVAAAERTNNQRLANNQQLQKEKEYRDESTKAANKGLKARAKSEKLINDQEPEGELILDELIFKYKDTEDLGKQWKEIKTGLEEYNVAKAGLDRQATMPGPFEKLWRQSLGTYKDFEKVAKDVQPYLDYYRKNGLWNPARKKLMGEFGMGPEQAETTLFPFTPEVKKELNTFPHNKNAPKILTPLAGKMEKTDYFPGTTYQMKPDEYLKFKDELGDFINKHNIDADPENNIQGKPINLIALRGFLNQEKRYAWQDISNAVNELIAEKRFVPDNPQLYQKAVIDESPMPGLNQLFDFMLKGKK